MSALHINTEDGARPVHSAREEPSSVEPPERMVEGREGMHSLPTPAPAKSVPESAAEALPGLLRLGAVTVAHTATWGIGAYVRSARRVAKAVVDPREAVRLVDDVTHVAGQVTDFAGSVAKGHPISEALERYGLPAIENARAVLEDRALRAGVEPVEPDPADRLRRSGEDLLRRSRDVWEDDSRHPAFAGILRDLAPDEARILVLLLKDGPQPSVDVVKSSVLGLRGTRMVARGLTMIGPRASVRYDYVVPQYLNNLTRLGLVWQSSEPVHDLLRYQVVEAQPDVIDAVRSVRGARIQRRSIHLTPFGQDFARACFADATEVAALPGHTAPPEAATETRPEV